MNVNLDLPHLDGYIVAATGSRAFKLSEDTESHLIAHLKQLQDKHGDELLVMSGMAEGWDEYVAKTAISLEIPFIAVVPHPTYGEYYWGRKSFSGTNRLDEFNSYLDRAFCSIYVCDTLYVDGVHANFVRNTYMVSQATEFVVWKTANSRGTEDCVRKIARAGKGHTLIGDSK